MKNPLAMSDEEVMGLIAPPSGSTDSTTTTSPTSATTPTQEETPVVETPVTPGGSPAAQTETATDTSTAPATTTATATTTAEQPVVEETTSAAQQTASSSTSTTTSTETPADSGSAAAPAASADGSAPDYKALYETAQAQLAVLMAPVKANGKTIDLKTPEEATQLMQMGANYTKKMQALAPYRKVLTMLENNNLLDENRISFLIDLDKKNPEAIKRLVKDSKIDPIDLGEESKTPYFEGNHKVTDEEVAFKTTLQDLRSNAGGTDTLQQINGWDQASKEVLWKNPELMNVIHSQRENGIYAQIQAEVDRRRTLGTLSPNVPFLHAYKEIGDELNAAGAFNKPIPGTPVAAATGTSVTPPSVAPVAVRAAAPKPATSNNDRVSAASSNRSTPREAKKFVNPLSLSDDEFLKQFEGRL